MGAWMSAKHSEEKEALCEQWEDAWPDRHTDPEGFNRAYEKFHSEDGRKNRRNGAYKGAARLLGILKVRGRASKTNAGVLRGATWMPAVFIRR